jgi:hypothetical protein
MQRRTVALSRDGLDARQRQRPADQSLGDSAPKSAAEPRDWPGGSAGDGKSPRKVWRGITAHTLYVFEWRRPAILYYGRRTLNCGEHYTAPYRYCVMHISIHLFLARYFCIAQGISTGILWFFRNTPPVDVTARTFPAGDARKWNAHSSDCAGTGLSNLPVSIQAGAMHVTVRGIVEADAIPVSQILRSALAERPFRWSFWSGHSSPVTDLNWNVHANDRTG